MACYPVYRSYIDQPNGGDGTFKAALTLAKQHNPKLSDGYSTISYLLKETKTSSEALHAIKRFQQFTGAVMAKGFEDTALYRYTRLLSLNEVGSNPAQFGISKTAFHEFNRSRQQNWPLTLNTTSTHDTKRGEDVRARLNVLSEIPDEVRLNLKGWAAVNASKKREVNGELAPSRNEEYYLYQTLLGTYPWDSSQKQEFTERISQHMVKALREAKVHTCWIETNLPYEDAVTAFASEILSDDAFLGAFLPFQQKIALYGFYNSLSQTLLKITCPGVPDFYQGTELWDLNLTDPDNRGPVDYQKRRALLREITQLKSERAPELLLNPSDGKAKLYLIYKALEFRKKQRLLFEQGEYLPLAVKGRGEGHVVAFCRKRADAYFLVVVPRFLSGLRYTGDGKSASSGLVAWGDLAVDWADTYISLPEGAPSRWSDVFTEKILIPCCGRLTLRDALDRFPLALLWGEGDG
jgi:(1->4)-alpha-D-glucan 1-alpha-D-glucosylmutase